MESNIHNCYILFRAVKGNALITRERKFLLTALIFLSQD